MSSPVLDDGKEVAHLRDRGWTWEQVAGEMHCTVPVAQRLVENYCDHVAELIQRDQFVLF